MITGIIFSNFETAQKHPSPIGVPTGYITPAVRPVVPVHKQNVDLKILNLKPT